MARRISSSFDTDARRPCAPKVIRSLPSLLAAVLLLNGCDNVYRSQDWTNADGTAEAYVDGRFYQFRVYAQPSAYDSDEVVLRAYSDLPRTLMLTFKLKRGDAPINRVMSGYWDLGLCTPSDSYLIMDEDDATVRVNDYDRISRRLEGTFDLRVESESEWGRTARFTKGHFEVHLRHESFEYCSEE